MTRRTENTVLDCSKGYVSYFNTCIPWSLLLLKRAAALLSSGIPEISTLGCDQTNTDLFVHQFLNFSYRQCDMGEPARRVRERQSAR